MIRSSQWSLIHQLFLPEACMHSKCPIHLILPYLTILLIFGEEYKLWSNFLQPLVSSSLLDPNVLLRTLFANTLSLSSLNVRNQVLYSYKTTTKNYSPILWCTDPLLCNDSVNTSPQDSARATIGHLLLCNGSVNMPKTIQDNLRWCFPWGPP
jgi:hypothetical protein